MTRVGLAGQPAGCRPRPRDEETEVTTTSRRFGVSTNDTRAFAVKALERRMKVIGLLPAA